MGKDMEKESVYHRIYLQNIFRSGLYKALKEHGVGLFDTLLVIASYADKNGYCYPTQKTIAEALGISERAVIKRIKKLLSFRWEGKPLITREMVPCRSGHRSVYYIQPISQITIFDGEVELIGTQVHDDISRTQVQDDKDSTSKVYPYPPVKSTGSTGTQVHEATGTGVHINYNHLSKINKQEPIKQDRQQPSNKDNNFKESNSDKDNKVNNSQVVFTVDKDNTNSIAGASTVEKKEITKPTTNTVPTQQPELDESTRRKADKVLTIYIETYNNRYYGREIRKLVGDEEKIVNSPLLNVGDKSYIRKAIICALAENERHGRKTTLEDVINNVEPQFIDKAIAEVDSVRENQTRKLVGA